MRSAAASADGCKCGRGDHCDPRARLSPCDALDPLPLSKVQRVIATQSDQQCDGRTKEQSGRVARLHARSSPCRQVRNTIPQRIDLSSYYLSHCFHCSAVPGRAACSSTHCGGRATDLLLPARLAQSRVDRPPLFLGRCSSCVRLVGLTLLTAACARCGFAVCAARSAAVGVRCPCTDSASEHPSQPRRTHPASALCRHAQQQQERKHNEEAERTHSLPHTRRCCSMHPRRRSSTRMHPSSSRSAPASHMGESVTRGRIRCRRHSRSSMRSHALHTQRRCSSAQCSLSLRGSQRS